MVAAAVERAYSKAIHECITMSAEEIALCQTVDDKSIFFPEDKRTRAEKEAARNKAIRLCGRCALQETCLQWGLAQEVQYGIWGGMTADERRKMLRSGTRPDRRYRWLILVT